MASSLINVCRFVPASGGLGDWVYSSNITGYLAPSAAGAVNGAIYSYRAESADLAQWEIGYGAYNSGTGTFARTTVITGSDGGSTKVNFSVAPQVAIVALADDIVRPGAVIGSVLATYASNATLSASANVPLDDSVPLVSEGTQIISQAYTPQIATSKLRCTFRGSVSSGSVENAIASIFAGSTNIGSTVVSIDIANGKTTMHIVAEYAPASLSAQTITVRAGGASTSIAFNGIVGTRQLGGSQAATLLIEEIKV